MIDLELEVKELQKELSNKDIKRHINKYLKIQYEANVITKAEYKNGKKKIKELLK